MILKNIESLSMITEVVLINDLSIEKNEKKIQMQFYFVKYYNKIPINVQYDAIFMVEKIYNF